MKIKFSSKIHYDAFGSEIQSLDAIKASMIGFCFKLLLTLLQLVTLVSSGTFVAFV